MKLFSYVIAIIGIRSRHFKTIKIKSNFLRLKFIEPSNHENSYTEPTIREVELLFDFKQHDHGWHQIFLAATKHGNWRLFSFMISITAQLLIITDLKKKCFGLIRNIPVQWHFLMVVN